MVNIKAVVTSIVCDFTEAALVVYFTVPTSVTPFTGGGAIGGIVTVVWTEHATLDGLRSAVLQAICDKVNEAPALEGFTLHSGEILMPELRMG